MQNKITKNNIIVTISRVTAEGKMFTAYDITLALRKEYPTANVKHNEVKAIVHNLFIEGHFPARYNSTIIKLAVDGEPYATLFHVGSDNPMDYALSLKPALDSTTSDIVGSSDIISQTSSDDSVDIDFEFVFDDNDYYDDYDDDDDDDDDYDDDEFDEYYIRCATEDGRINLPKALCMRNLNKDGSVTVCLSGLVNCNVPQNKDGRHRLTVCDKNRKGSSWKIDSYRGTIQVNML